MDIPKAMTPDECKAHLADCNIDGNFCYGLHERGPDEDPHEARLCLATLAAEQHRRDMAWFVKVLRERQQLYILEYDPTIGCNAGGAADAMGDLADEIERVAGLTPDKADMSAQPQ